MRIADELISFARSFGTSTAFCLTGGMSMHLNRALFETPDMRTIFLHHETSVVAAADGYSRTHQMCRPGLAVITSGPAVTNALTGLASAFVDSVPVLVLAGQVKTSDINQLGLRSHGLQEVDQLALTRPITKYADRVTSENIADVFRNVAQALRSGRLGPVFLEVPLDEQSRNVQLEPTTSPDSIAIAGADTADTDEALSKLLDERYSRPVVLLGNGLRSQAQRLSPVLDALHRLKIPRLYTWSSFDLEPGNHTGNLGCPGPWAPIHANRVLTSSDLLIILGARLDLATTGFAPHLFGSQAKRLVVDVDALELSKLDSNASTFLLEADAFDVLKALLGAGLIGDADWYTWCNNLKNSSLDEEHSRLDSPELTVREVALLVSQFAQNKVVVPGSSGLAIETFIRFFRPQTGTTIFNGASLGSMGLGLSQGVGAFFGEAKDGVWVFEGDGGLLMSCHSLATVAGNIDRGFALFILNNSGYASIAASQGRTYGYTFGAGLSSGLSFPNWEQLSSSFGIPHTRISTKQHLLSVLKSWVPSQRTEVFELVVPPTEPRGPQVVTTFTSGAPQTAGLETLSWT